jgi:hypothetical protein
MHRVPGRKFSFCDFLSGLRVHVATYTRIAWEGSRRRSSRRRERQSDRLQRSRGGHDESMLPGTRRGSKGG